MSNEEKILELLAQIQKEQKQMRGEQQQMQEDITGLKDGQRAMQEDITGLKDGLRATQEDITGLKDGQRAMQEDITGLKDGLRATQEDISAVKLRLELDVEKRFDAVNEGVDTILEQLTPKRRVEEMDADITVLKTAVKMLTQEVAELKKAQ